MRLDELITADEPLPMWATIIRNGLAADPPKKFYFSGGGNRIVRLSVSRAGGMEHIVLHLEHTKRKKFGHPEKQTYTIWQKSYDGLTLKRFEDGARLVFKKDTEPVKESVEDPTVYSMFQKLLADGQKVFFRNRAGKKTRLRHAMTGVSTSGKPAWWFFDSDNPAHRKAIVWKVGETIDKLTLKKDGDHWMLFDRTVKLKEGADEPIVISMAHKLIEKGIKVTFDFMDKQRDFTRWCNGPLKYINTKKSQVDDVTYYQVVYDKGRGLGSDTCNLNEYRLGLLKLFPDGQGGYTLSDRKPQPDDEAL